MIKATKETKETRVIVDAVVKKDRKAITDRVESQARKVKKARKAKRV